jgi:hypothetical protein
MNLALVRNSRPAQQRRIAVEQDDIQATFRQGEGRAAALKSAPQHANPYQNPRPPTARLAAVLAAESEPSQFVRQTQGSGVRIARRHTGGATIFLVGTPPRAALQSARGVPLG